MKEKKLNRIYTLIINFYKVHNIRNSGVLQKHNLIFKIKQLGSLVGRE